MRFLVISDTHGKTGRVAEIYKKLTDIDAMIHLGDYRQDAEELAQELNLDCYCVDGNLDRIEKRKHEFLHVECGKILLTHGHRENVKRGMSDLLSLCREEDCTGAFFGHTHMPFYDEIRGITLLNPGSISFPRSGDQGSYAIVTTDEQGIHASILYYSYRDTEKPQGGYLRSLMNYSDGF